MGSWFFSSLSEAWRVSKYSRHSATQMLPSRASGFCRENFGLGNIRRLGKQFFGFGKQRFGNFSVQVSVAAVLVGKGIEYSVLSRAQLNCVPANRGRFPLCQRLRRLQEVFYFFLFSRFRFQLRPNGKSAHSCFLLRIRCTTRLFGHGLIAEFTNLASNFLRYNCRIMSLAEQ